MQTKYYSRRKFLTQASLAAAATVAATQVSTIAVAQQPAGKIKDDHLTFLFQGDSITDGNRGRNTDPNHIMGHGYAFSIASRAGAMFPEKGLSFYNRGISGNTVADLKARWQQDTLDIKPDVLSILVGINDTGQAIKQKDTAATKKYEDGYRALLQQTKEQLPDCILVLCEPFIAPVGHVKSEWIAWQTEVRSKQEVVHRLAKEYEAIFVPLQKVFDDAAHKAAADYWIWDGIHPTVAGHEMITQEWLKQVSKRLDFLKNLL